MTCDHLVRLSDATRTLRRDTHPQPTDPPSPTLHSGKSSYYGVRDDGQVLANGFPTVAAAWRWIDRNVFWRRDAA